MVAQITGCGGIELRNASSKAKTINGGKSKNSERYPSLLIFMTIPQAQYTQPPRTVLALTNSKKSLGVISSMQFCLKCVLADPTHVLCWHYQSRWRGPAPG